MISYFRNSLTRKLILWYVISFVALLSAGNLFLYYLLRSSIESDRSAILEDRFNAISMLLQQPKLDELQRRVTQEWPARRSEITFFRLFDAQGRVIVETPGFMEQHSLGLDNPREYLVRTKTLYAFDHSAVTTIGVIDDKAGAFFLHSYSKRSVVIILFSALISILFGWQIIRRGLFSLTSMKDTVQKIDWQNLHARLDMAPLPAELQPLASALNQTLERLEESFARLSRFSSNIAHELRTPVNNLLGELEVHLNRPRTAEENSEILASVIEECARLRQIIESLLFLARAENAQQGLQIEQVNAEETLKSLVDFYEAAAAEANITLSIEFGSGSIFLRGEKTLFQQAISNLISNALRYTKSGGGIFLRLDKQVDKFARIVVRDSGCGIEAAHLPHIFDRFYRADFSRDPNSGGVGLGLAIVKSIVDLHGGEIQVESRVAEGTTITIHWPLS